MTARARLFTRTCTLYALLRLASPSVAQTTGWEITADSTVPPGGIYTRAVGVGVSAGTPWQYLGATPSVQNGPDFIVVSPSIQTSGATGITLIGLNPTVFPYLRPGGYAVLARFGQPGQPPSATYSIEVQLIVDPPPPPAVTSVVSAASLQPQISPGEIISIFGANIGTPPVSGLYNDSGLYPTTLGNTTVTIGGTPAPLLYVSTTQINALVPFEVAGQKSADLVVTHDDVAAPALSVPIVDTSPSIFTATGTGKGQGAIQNTMGPLGATANSASNPAPANSVIAIYATGGGTLNQTVQDGIIILPPGGYAPKAAVSLTIGGQPAQINYAGAAPYEVAGMLQINAVVPQGIGSGAQPVVLKIGNNDNSTQQVTVAVK